MNAKLLISMIDLCIYDKASVRFQFWMSAKRNLNLFTKPFGYLLLPKKLYQPKKRPLHRSIHIHTHTHWHAHSSNNHEWWWPKQGRSSWRYANWRSADASHIMVITRRWPCRRRSTVSPTIAVQFIQWVTTHTHGIHTQRSIGVIHNQWTRFTSIVIIIYSIYLI